MPFNQKFDLVSESHHFFFYRFFILSKDIAQNACVYTFELDSKVVVHPTLFFLYQYFDVVTFLSSFH